ncbi:Extracellular protein SEL-1 [Phytophthora cinnamomi]|uniref:Extracellular protein SEL-1 n=1 Tax=Phytophthora cinnamomi TaxID=4785 RepID=UPI0035596878|nr:Extracellular protein SEL-1 [Phytophthora cinnamomi]
MASEPNSVVTSPLPGLTPAAMSPTSENVTSQEDATAAKKADTMTNTKVQPTREPKLLFAVAKNVVNASRATRSNKQSATSGKSPVASAAEGNASARTMFGIIKRAQTSKPELLPAQDQPQQLSQPSEESHAVKQQSSGESESRHSSASVDAVSLGGEAIDDHSFVDDVRETLEKLLTQLDSVDPRKLLAVRLGGELRGLLGKAQDEFAAYEAEFVEHAANEGVSVALQNFSASLTQVSAIAERLRTAKFLLNRTFKREVLFAFQEINSYYTSLFMELSMAVARRSGIDLPLPAPVTPPPPPEPTEIPAPTGDEICLEAHQYFFGHGVAKNLQKALGLYTQAADLGCAVAMTCLGQMYFAGNGTEKDILVAGKWFELASSAGDLEACHQLGLLMCEKAAHLKDARQSDEFFALARVRFSQAAEQGHRDAQYELGIFHEHGRGGCEPNDMEAATWYAKAADQGHTGAEASLGRLFLVGKQIQQDVAKAVHFLQRAAAKSDSSAQTRLGLLYTTGNGVKQDMERGVAFLQSAADAGSSVAMTRLACLLLHTTQANDVSDSSPFSTQFRDREESHDEALRLLLSAGNGGHTDAYYELGKLLETSTLLRDQAAALRFYSKAATATMPLAKAAKRVATMCYSGIGCTSDKLKAHRFYAIAANVGDAEALNALGLMYEEGEGCDLNFLKAAECYRRGADLNSPHAHFNLGCLLSHGKGVPRNADAAQAHFRKATELGYSLAQQFVLDEAR